MILPQPKLTLWRLLKTLKLRVRCSLTVRLGLSALERRAYHRSRTYARLTTLMRKTAQHPCARAGLSTPISSATDRVKKADDGFFHVTPDLVVVEKTKSPNHYTVTLVDVTFCLEHRVVQAIATKRSHYKPLCEALRRQGHTVPEVTVNVICVRGSIPTSTLETLKLLGLNQEPAETLLRKRTSLHVNTCVEYATLAEPLNQ